MKKNDLLSIAIPTYNRAPVLKKLLNNLIPKVKPYNIAIYISDNASNDDTQSVVKEMKATYNFIYYSRNETNLGMDRNFEKVLKMSEAKYCWLLGDDDTIDDGGIEKVLEIIGHSVFYDVIVVNGCSYDKATLKNKYLRKNIYTDCNELLRDLFATMNWISILIISQELISEADFDRYCGTNYIHLGAILDYLGKKDAFNIFYEHYPMVIAASPYNIINSYMGKVLFYSAKGWVDLLLLLPDKYTKKSRLKAAIQSPICLKYLVYLRIRKHFNYNEVKKYKKYFKYVTKTPYIFIVIVSVMPANLLKLLCSPYIAYRILSGKYMELD
jgi:glycosyltransferase involved in cell wall biosynthesis